MFRNFVNQKLVQAKAKATNYANSITQEDVNDFEKYCQIAEGNFSGLSRSAPSVPTPKAPSHFMPVMPSLKKADVNDWLNAEWATDGVCGVPPVLTEKTQQSASAFSKKPLLFGPGLIKVKQDITNSVTKTVKPRPFETFFEMEYGISLKEFKEPSAPSSSASSITRRKN